MPTLNITPKISLIFVQKPDITVHLLHFYNLLIKVYVLQLHILKVFEVKVQQSISNRKINLYSKYREIKLQVLTKTDVTYKQRALQTRNLHHHASHELRNGCY